MNVKILDLKRESKVGKTSGKAFISLRLKTEEYAGKWMSGFGGDENKDWKVGDTVDVEVETKGEYLNFKTNKVNAVSRGQGDDSRVFNLINLKILPLLEFMAEDMKAIRKKQLLGGEYPEQDETNDAHGLDEPEDEKIPF